MNESPSQNSWSKSAAPPSSKPPSYPQPLKPRPKFLTVLPGILALLGVGVTAWVVSIYVDSPKIATPTRPPIPKPNGFDALKVAGEKIVRKDDIGTAASRTAKVKWTSDRKQKLVQENKGALDAARAALQLPYMERNNYVSLDTPFPHYLPFRNLARLFSLSGDLAWKSGDHRRAVDDSLSAITIGRRVPHRAILIGALVGLACEIIGRRPLWDNLEQMDEKTAMYCLKRLESLQKERLPFSVTLEEESYTAQHIIVETYAHPENFANQAETETEREESYGAIVLYTKMIPKRVALKTMREHMDKLIAQSKQPYPLSKVPLPLPEEPITASLLPVFDGARVKFIGIEAGDALLRTALALRIYHLRNGNYPANLSDLFTSKILSSVPDDPFALPGNKLRYKSLPNGKYLLYSIGPDSVDDNGKGMQGKNKEGKDIRTVDIKSKGDMTVGWYTY